MDMPLDSAGRILDAYHRHAAVSHFAPLFAREHLPAALQEIAAPVAQLASDMTQALPDDLELMAGLRKLLEAKDCFVRARVIALTRERLAAEEQE
jgi:hypothetical protein